MIKELDLNTFKEYCQLDSIIVLYTKWCPICKMLLFKLEEFGDEHPEIALGKLDVSNIQMDEYKISTKNVPLTIINKDGKITEKIRGMIDLGDLEEIISH